jgi:hypothetical protein
MRELGHPIRWKPVIKGAVDEIVDEMRNPWVAFCKLASVLRQRFGPDPRRKAIGG